MVSYTNTPSHKDDRGEGEGSLGGSHDQNQKLGKHMMSYSMMRRSRGSSGSSKKRSPPRRVPFAETSTSVLKGSSNRTSQRNSSSSKILTAFDLSAEDNEVPDFEERRRIQLIIEATNKEIEFKKNRKIEPKTEKDSEAKTPRSGHGGELRHRSPKSLKLQEDQVPLQPPTLQPATVQEDLNLFTQNSEYEEEQQRNRDIVSPKTQKQDKEVELNMFEGSKNGDTSIRYPTNSSKQSKSPRRDTLSQESGRRETLQGHSIFSPYNPQKWQLNLEESVHHKKNSSAHSSKQHNILKCDSIITL